MLNGTTGAGAVCCQYPANTGGVEVNTKPVSIGGVQVNVPRNAKGLLSQIGDALNQAIHGGDSLRAQRLIDSAARAYSGGASVIPFPMVNPFKPILAVRAPVTGLTRFPKRFTQEVENTDSEPDDEQSSLDGLSGISGLGLYDDVLGPPPPVPILVNNSSGGGTLRTILGTIQATLPSTIQALRANPSNIFPGASYDPYAPNRSYVPTTGRAAEDVGAGVGRAADTLGQTATRFVAEHPYLVIGGGAALFLLFMKPPSRRR